jgi:ADP-sugar diphosphatase
LLAHLSGLVYKDRFKGVFPTVGGSDEFLRLFAFQKEVTREYLSGLQGKCTGLACENEQITLKVIPLRDLPVEVPDAKALSALMLYQTLQSFGAL